MKHEEEDEQEQANSAQLVFLQKVFAEPGHDIEAVDAVPLLDMPAGLSDKLYAIADGHKVTHSPRAVNRIATAVSSLFHSWQSWGAIAASLVIVAMLVQMNEQRKTTAQLQKAQQDLAVAMHYLNEANKVLEDRMLSTLASNMQKATVDPVVAAVYSINRPQIGGSHSVDL